MPVFYFKTSTICFAMKHIEGAIYSIIIDIAIVDEYDQVHEIS